MYNALIGEELFLPDQIGKGSKWTPEQELLYAMLNEAIATYHRYRGYTRVGKESRQIRLAREAYAWLTSPAEYPFSFRHVCMVLGFEPDYIRRGIIDAENLSGGQARLRSNNTQPRLKTKDFPGVSSRKQWDTQKGVAA